MVDSSSTESNALRIHWTYTCCDTEDERRLEDLWEDRQAAMEAKLAEVPAEPSELRLAVHHETDEDAWSMQAALHLPGRTLVADAEGDSLDSVFERFVCKLARAIDLYEERPTRTVERRSGLHAVLPFLERFHSAGRSQTFFAFLVPLMRSLRPYVRRELEILQMNESVPEESLGPADVLDEAMLRAWERFDERPASSPIDLWLTRIVDDILADVAGDQRFKSLDERVPLPLPEPDDDTSADFWVEREDYPESIEFGDLLAGPEGIDDRESKARRRARARDSSGLRLRQRNRQVGPAFAVRRHQGFRLWSRAVGRRNSRIC